VAALFALKGRPETGALPLVAGSSEQIRRALGGLNETATRLAGRYWPGPLSLLIAAPPEVTDAVHAGTGAVAVRVPANDVATALAHALGYPVTATSANRTGAPPAQRPVELDWLAADPRVYVIDAGETPGGLPSTIVDTRQEPLALVREVAVPWDHVLDFLRA
jgi:L-threonylcarbamoyladenylate synthase